MHYGLPLKREGEPDKEKERERGVQGFCAVCLTQIGMKGMKTYKWKSIGEDSRGEEEKAVKYNTDKCRVPERKEETDRDYFIVSEDNADCCVHRNCFLFLQSASPQTENEKLYHFHTFICTSTIEQNE